jgi:hypothetical protein
MSLAGTGALRRNASIGWLPASGSVHRQCECGLFVVMGGRVSNKDELLRSWQTASFLCKQCSSRGIVCARWDLADVLVPCSGAVVPPSLAFSANSFNLYNPSSSSFRPLKSNQCFAVFATCLRTQYLIIHF